MPNEGLIRALRKTVGKSSLCLLSLQHLVAISFRRGIETGIFDDQTIDWMRSECIRGMRSSEAAGLPIDDEAEILRQALHDLEELIDGAIQMARDERPL